MVCGDNRRGRGCADIGRLGDGNTVYIDSENPGAGQHEKTVNKNPDKRSKHKRWCGRQPRDFGARAHAGDEYVDERRSDGGRVG